MVGIASLSVIHWAAAFIVLRLRAPLNQSLLWLFVGPAIIGVVWIASGLVLGVLVMDRDSGRYRFGKAFAYAAMFAFGFCAIAMSLMNSHPDNYQGP